MSRVAKNPVSIPNEVEVNLTSTEITVKGPLGTATQLLSDSVAVRQENNQILFAAKEDSKHAKAMSGTLRVLVNNLVIGVQTGFQRKLNLVGVGYRAQAQSSDAVNLSLGFSHPIVHQMPAGVSVETPVPTEILLKSTNKQLLGQVAAEIRAYRPPEPYKGKGVRYSDEKVVLKETKKK